MPQGAGMFLELCASSWRNRFSPGLERIDDGTVVRRSITCPPLDAASRMPYRLLLLDLVQLLGREHGLIAFDGIRSNWCHHQQELTEGLRRSVVVLLQIGQPAFLSSSAPLHPVTEPHATVTIALLAVAVVAGVLLVITRLGGG